MGPIPTTAHTCFFAIVDLRGSARWRRRGGSASVRRRRALWDPHPRATRSAAIPTLLDGNHGPGADQAVAATTLESCQSASISAPRPPLAPPSPPPPAAVS